MIKSAGQEYRNNVPAIKDKNNERTHDNNNNLVTECAEQHNLNNDCFETTSQKLILCENEVVINEYEACESEPDDDEDYEFVPGTPSSVESSLSIPIKKKHRPDRKYICNLFKENIAEPIIPQDNEENSPEFSPITPKRKRGNNLKKNLGRKRLSFPSQWIRNQYKEAVNSGKSHNYTASGKQIQERKIGLPCGSLCRLQCSSKFSDGDRKIIFDRFWQLESKTRKWDFIISNTETKDKKVATVASTSRRSCSRKFYLPTNGSLRQQVCLTMFLSTLSINYQWVTTPYNKFCFGSGILSPDKRGKHVRPLNEILQKTKQSVRDHINKFPLIESHYVRKDTTRNYIDGSLNISKMYRMYLEWFHENQISQNKATERQYRDIFVSEFNISFFIPKKDRCDECEAYINMSSAEKEEKFEAHTLHLANKDKAREMKDLDKLEASCSNGKIFTACFDFQKVLTCPNADISIFYYKRKLSTFNFTIFTLNNNVGHCYAWDETVSKKGANEVCSCLFKYMVSGVNQGVGEFRFWSDNCSGQNRNRCVFGFFAWFSNRYSVDITHRFLEKGHTQNEGDSMHAVIEKAKKGKLIYVPSEWYTVIRNAKAKGQQYNLTEMSQNSFLNFMKLVGETNWVTDNLNNRIMWSKIREISVRKERQFEIHFKYNFSEEPKICNLLKKSSRKSKQIKDFEPEQIYSTALPISELKKKDLNNLCDGNYIPKYYHQFYRDLKGDSQAETLFDEDL